MAKQTFCEREGVTQFSKTKRTDRRYSFYKIMPLEPTEKLRVQNGNLGIQMTNAFQRPQEWNSMNVCQREQEQRQKEKQRKGG